MMGRSAKFVVHAKEDKLEPEEIIKTLSEKVGAADGFEVAAVDPRRTTAKLTSVRSTSYSGREWKTRAKWPSSPAPHSSSFGSPALSSVRWIPFHW